MSRAEKFSPQFFQTIRSHILPDSLPSEVVHVRGTVGEVCTQQTRDVSKGKEETFSAEPQVLPQVLPPHLSPTPPPPPPPHEHLNKRGFDRESRSWAVSHGYHIHPAPELKRDLPLPLGLHQGASLLHQHVSLTPPDLSARQRRCQPNSQSPACLPPAC